MKINIIILSVFLTFSTRTSGQNYFARYNITYKPDSNALKNIIREEASLVIAGREESVYATLNFLKKDSVLGLLNQNKISAESLMASKNNPKTHFDHFIKKTHKNHETLVYELIATSTFVYQVDDTFSWEITNEADTISGYHCIKATTKFAGRRYEAWFTPQIPISDGPYVFYGLPGLIVKIYDDKNHYDFTLTWFKKYEDPFLNEPSFKDKAVRTTREKVFLVREEQRQDPLGFLERNIGFRLTTPIDDDVRKRISANNNPIELNR